MNKHRFSWWRPVVRALAVALALGVVGLVLTALVYLPLWQVDRIVFPTAQTFQEQLQISKERATLENEFRRTVTQVVGGLFFVFGALSGAFFTLRQIAVTRDGQITDRFTKAITHLGNTGNIAVRLGGIYALERIARDSPKDHWTIVETLAGFIRENAPARTTLDRGDVSALRTVKTDIQAALTALARRTPTKEPGRIELHTTNLEGAVLNGAHLKGAILEGAHLERANLIGAHLEGAHLWNAHLESARLNGAHLEGAILVGAHLEGAWLIGAHLEDAWLDSAHLEGALLNDAHLKGARLKGAHLKGAHLKGAHLEGARLKGAHLEDAELDGVGLADLAEGDAEP